MRREESKGDVLPSKAEGAAEGDSFDGPAAGLTGVVITRAQAIKLAGLGGAGFLFTLLWPAPADARKRRRRKRKATVSPNPVSLPGTPVVLNVTNESGRELTISEVRVLDKKGKVIATEEPLLGPVTIAPGETGVVTVNIDEPLVVADADKLTLIDENGVKVGDVDVA